MASKYDCGFYATICLSLYWRFPSRKEDNLRAMKDIYDTLAVYGHGRGYTTVNYDKCDDDQNPDYDYQKDETVTDDELLVTNVLTAAYLPQQVIDAVKASLGEHCMLISWYEWSPRVEE